MAKKRRGMPRGAVWVGSIILGCLAAAVVWIAAPKVFGDGPVPIKQETSGLISNIQSLLEKPAATSTEVVEDKSPLKVVPGDEERYFKITDGAEWNIVLRQQNGEPYTEIRVLGMSGEKTAIVYGRTDIPVILRIERSGSIREMYRLPYGANVLGFGNGAVWLAISEPGEGLESEPIGPITYIRVDLNGVAKEVLKDDVVY